MVELQFETLPEEICRLCLQFCLFVRAASLNVSLNRNCGAYLSDYRVQLNAEN
jgi:hypothetical protein